MSATPVLLVISDRLKYINSTCFEPACGRFLDRAAPEIPNSALDPGGTRDAGSEMAGLLSHRLRRLVLGGGGVCSQPARRVHGALFLVVRLPPCRSVAHLRA